MSASKLIPFVCLLACFLKLSLSKDQQQTVKTGDDVTLQCLDHRGGDITLLEWTRPDVKSEGYVFYYREKDLNEDYQHKSFHGRVELVDPEKKNGIFSMILKNVTINDTGTYECRVGYGGRPELISNITLTVRDSGGDKDGGDKHGEVGLVVDQQQITVKTGDDVTLQCLDHRGGNITLLEWRRVDLENEGYVFYFREKDLNEDYQHKSFHCTAGDGWFGVRCLAHTSTCGRGERGTNLRAYSREAATEPLPPESYSSIIVA